ncbi:hypothetical protein HPP92_019402 [Vanilla planifolia]|uniref:Uncharacterized protein n=1 Tax=Vanilla planifolia TaxID=51239 RepID=A0A835Q5Q5_VANPL|nr:hypothetical protein HPP92_019402 [Vanilla planifolia]
MNVVPTGHGRSSLRISPAASKKTPEWVPLEKHALFRSGTGGMSPVIAAADTDGPSYSFLRNLLAWDANSCRLYLWDAQSRCVHRLVVRFCDQVSSSSSPSSSFAVLEAASPSEKLVTDIEINYTVHHISLNTSGSTLLLIGSEGLSVIYLYEQSCTNISNKCYRTVILGSGLFSKQYSGLRILQATWHPYSSNHIGVLSSDSVFRLFDLSSDLEQAEQEFYFQVEKPFGSQNMVSIYPIAFSFGGQLFWERFSMFILYNNGSLYILCPIVPFGSLCKWTFLKEIYEDAHAYELKSSDSSVGRNLSLIITWLEATFPELADPQMEGDDGPLVHASMEEKKNGTDVSSSYCEGKPVAFIFNSIGKDSVFITGWSSGFLQIEALIDEVQPLWKVGLSPHLRVNANGNIEGIATICQSYMEEASTNYNRRLDCALNLMGAADAVENKDLPHLLKLAIVDLSLSECAKMVVCFPLFLIPLYPRGFTVYTMMA